MKTCALSFSVFSLALFAACPASAGQKQIRSQYFQCDGTVGIEQWQWEAGLGAFINGEPVPSNRNGDYYVYQHSDELMGSDNLAYSVADDNQSMLILWRGKRINCENRCESEVLGACQDVEGAKKLPKEVHWIYD